MSLIALDIDEVLLDCISRLNGLAKQLFNANIINQDAWCLGDRYGISDDQVSHIFSMGEGLYANLKPMPYVNSLINLIKSNKLEDKIIFCSSSPEDVIECRVQNLKDIGLDFASKDNTFLLGINANKGEFLKDKNVSLVLDDRLKNINSCVEHGITGIHVKTTNIVDDTSLIKNIVDKQSSYIRMSNAYQGLNYYLKMDK